MKLPPIVQLRRTLIARRQSTLFNRHPGLLLLVAFAGPLLAVTGISTYYGMRQYVAEGLPAVPLLLVLLAVWIGVGLNRQLRLNRDRKWNNFVNCMPVRPVHLLVLNAYVGIPAGVIGVTLLVCALCGAGAELWTLEATAKWLVVGATFLWVLSLQSFFGLVASRFPWGQRLMVLVLALWGILFVGRVAWSTRSGSPYTCSMMDTCLSDPALLASGFVSLVRTLIPQGTAFPVTGFWTVLHLASVTTVFTALSRRLIRRPPLILPARPGDLFLTTPLRKLISSILPESWGGQICVELLRMLRGPRSRLLFYVTVSVIVALGLGVKYPDGGNHILVLIAFVVFAANERADLLQIRHADSLYYMYGVDSRDYLRGLTTSVGILISVLCIIQVPLFRDCDIGTCVKTISVCIAVAFSTTGMNVAFDHYYRNTGFFRYLITIMLFLAVISKSWGMILLVVVLFFNVIRVPCFIYTLTLLFISFSINAFLPLLIAGVLFVSEITRADREFVKKWYWKVVG